MAGNFISEDIPGSNLWVSNGWKKIGKLYPGAKIVAKKFSGRLRRPANFLGLIPGNLPPRVTFFRLPGYDQHTVSICIHVLISRNFRVKKVRVNLRNFNIVKRGLFSKLLLCHRPLIRLPYWKIMYFLRFLEIEIAKLRENLFCGNCFTILPANCNSKPWRYSKMRHH